MKKIQNINLGGYPITIDEDAYEHLNSYLTTIQKHFSTSEGCDEIIADIENRLAELVTEKLGGNKIVSLKEVKSAIAIMGTPEDFGAQTIESEPITNNNSQNTTSNKTTTSGQYTVGKRLFRDEDDKVLGGVCSGIAAYLGFQETVWVRLFFIVLVWTGFSPIVYFLLWAILPKAITTTDRLMMRGAPINIDNIAKEVEDGFHRITNKITDMGNEMNGKADGKKKIHSVTNAFVSATSQGISIVGEVFRAIFRTFGAIGRPILAVFGTFLLLILGISWIATSGVLVYGFPYLSYFSPEGIFSDGWIFLSALLFLGIPIVTVILFLLRHLFKLQINRWLYVGLWGAWVLNAMGFGFLGAEFGKAFNAERDITKSYDISTTETTPLQLEIGKNVIGQNKMQFDGLRLGDDFLVDENIKLTIEKADGNAIQLEQTNTSHGQNFEQAEQYAREINYNPITETNRLVLPPHFLIPKGKKFRGQEVGLTLKIPVGKSFEFASNTNDLYMSIREKRNGKTSRYDEDFEQGQVWKMTEKGLKCEKNCPANSSSFDREETEAKEERENAIKDLKADITDLKDDIKDKEDDLKDASDGEKANLRNEIREIERQLREKEKELKTIDN
jgi:phage shock protein PspC (stress-responsive transcriptional regulator)